MLLAAPSQWSHSACEATLRSADAWTLSELPNANVRVLAGGMHRDSLVQRLNEEMLVRLPPAECLSNLQARQLMVHLGLWGSSVARHQQEQVPALKANPERSFKGQIVGEERTAFLDYVAAVADRTGTGHPPRDAYASLVRWNVPTVRVEWEGEVLSSLDGVFDDLAVRTYTNDAGERQFLALLKRAEAIEAVVNGLLRPLRSGQIDIAAPEWSNRALRAADLLSVVHLLNGEFESRAGHAGLDADHFLDVLRQFAVHWRRDDVAPSGAQDPEYLLRDFILGINVDDYARHVRRIYPALLAAERDDLDDGAGRTPLPSLVLQHVGVTSDAIASMSPSAILETVRRVPALAACYLLLRANAQVASSHLGVTKRLLFNPMRQRDAAGIPDSELVSNRAGTTGMLERLLESLTLGRKRHPLEPLKRLAPAKLQEAAGFSPRRPARREDLDQIARLV